MRFLSILILGLFLFVGCTNNDLDDVSSTQDKEIPSFKGLSFASDALYEYTFNTAAQEGVYRNLTLEENYPLNYEFVHNQEGVFGLYRLQNVWIRDIVNSATEQFLDYTPSGGIERRERVVNDNVHIAVLYRRLDDLDQLQLRLINVQNNVQQNVNFGTQEGISQLYLNGNNAIVTLDDISDDSTKLFVIDVSTGVVKLDLLFDTTDSAALVFGDENDFYFFDGANNSYRYGFASLELISTSPSAFRGQSGRHYQLKNNRIESDFFYVQPSFFERGPQLFDLSTNTALKVDIGAALTSFLRQRENVSAITNTDFAYDQASDSWIANYEIRFNDSTPNEFGILHVSQEGVVIGSLLTERAINRLVTVVD